MKSQNVPETEWTGFFDHLNHDHAGWQATIQMLHSQYGPQKIAVDLPFQGISFDTKGTRPSSLEVSAGDRFDDHVSHVVDLPLHIRQMQEPNGSIDLQIEPADGPVTLIHLQPPAVSPYAA